MVGRLVSFWDGIFSGAMLNFQGVKRCCEYTSCRGWPEYTGAKSHWIFQDLKDFDEFTVDGRNPIPNHLTCMKPWDIYHIKWFSGSLNHQQYPPICWIVSEDGRFKPFADNQACTKKINIGATPWVFVGPWTCVHPSKLVTRLAFLHVP